MRFGNEMRNFPILNQLSFMKALYSFIRGASLTLGIVASFASLEAQSPLTLFLNPVAGNGPLVVNTNFNEYTGPTAVVQRLRWMG